MSHDGFQKKNLKNFRTENIQSMLSEYNVIN